MLIFTFLRTIKYGKALSNYILDAQHVCEIDAGTQEIKNTCMLGVYTELPL